MQDVLRLLESREWNDGSMGGKEVARYISEDVFDVSGFCLAGCTAGCWEFAEIRNRGRGFVIFYDPDVVTEPQSEFHVMAGNVAFSFPAECITEAYVMHNRINLDDCEYRLVDGAYAQAERKKDGRVVRLAEKYGTDAASDAFGLTGDHVLELVNRHHAEEG